MAMHPACDWNPGDGGSIDDEDWRNELGEAAGSLPSSPPTFLFPSSQAYFGARKVVEHMRDRDSDTNLSRCLARRSVEVSKGDLEVAWWLMMVRGIAWDMSCYQEPWPEDGAILYPALFGDQTPVILA